MDLSYWNKVYQLNVGEDDRGRKLVHFPSPFAIFCAEKVISKEDLILDFGTGNGRDAFFFAEKGCKVHGIDQSAVAIKNNIIRAKELHLDNQLTFQCGDFSKAMHINIKPSVVYLRFVLHAICSADEENLLKIVEEKLDTGGMFLIESRTNKDKVYGCGSFLGDNAYKYGHCRRFIDSCEFLKRAQKRRFRIRYFNEDYGLDAYKDEDPIVMRVFFEKH